jgi:hypothetical protein
MLFKWLRTGLVTVFGQRIQAAQMSAVRLLFKIIRQDVAAIAGLQ